MHYALLCLVEIEGKGDTRLGRVILFALFGVFMTFSVILFRYFS